MLTIGRLNEMLELQEKLEVRIDGDDWRDKGHDYRLCVHMECAEIIDHYPWKHWKGAVNTLIDEDAVAMEIVDVWHFAMAFVLMSPKFDSKVFHYQILEAIEEYDYEEERTVDQLCIGLSYGMYATGQFPLGNFIGLMNLVEMDFDQLYKLYVAKNVLNWFRQDNDYATGLYLKNWAGKEDNEHVHELIELLEDDLTAGILYDHLKQRYALVVR